MRTFKESIKLTKDKVSRLWGMIVAVWGILGVALGFYDYPWVYLGIVLFGVAVTVVYGVGIFLRLNSDVVPIKITKRPNRFFVIMKDGYCENFSKMLYDCSISKMYRKKKMSRKRTCFVCGIDRTCNIGLAASSGVLIDFKKYLDERNLIKEEGLKQLIKLAKELQYPNKELLDYGDVLVVDVPIPESAIGSRVRILFVADSQKTELGEVLGDNDLIEGGDSRATIIKVFEKCREVECDTLFLAAAGTQMLKFPYTVSVMEILNSFVLAAKKGVHPFNVVLSIRNEDMRRYSIKQDELITYIHQTLRMYKNNL